VLADMAALSPISMDRKKHVSLGVCARFSRPRRAWAAAGPSDGC